MVISLNEHGNVTVEIISIIELKPSTYLKKIKINQSMPNENEMSFVRDRFHWVEE